MCKWVDINVIQTLMSTIYLICWYYGQIRWCWKQYKQFAVAVSFAQICPWIFSQIGDWNPSFIVFYSWFKKKRKYRLKHRKHGFMIQENRIDPNQNVSDEFSQKIVKKSWFL